VIQKVTNQVSVMSSLDSGRYSKPLSSHMKTTTDVLKHQRRVLHSDSRLYRTRCVRTTCPESAPDGEMAKSQSYLFSIAILKLSLNLHWQRFASFSSRALPSFFVGGLAPYIAHTVNNLVDLAYDDELQLQTLGDCSSWTLNLLRILQAAC